MIRLRAFRIPAAWLKALGWSTAVVAGLVLLEGYILVNRGTRLAGSSGRTSVIDFAWSEVQQRGVTIVRATPRRPMDSMEHATVLLDRDNRPQPLSQLWQDLSPRRVALIGSPEKTILACGDGSLYLLYSTPSGERRRLVGRHPSGEPHQLLCAPDGVTAITLGGAFLCGWDTARQRLMWAMAAGPIECIALNADESQLVCGRDDGLVELRDVQTGELRHSIRCEAGPFGAVAVCLGGNRLAALRESQVVGVWDLHTGQTIWTARVVAGGSRTLSVSPCGKWLAVGSLTQGRQWRVTCFEAATGANRRMAGRHTATINGTVFAGSEKIFSWSADGSVRLCEAATGRETAHWLPRASR